MPIDKSKVKWDESPPIDKNKVVWDSGSSLSGQAEIKTQTKGQRVREKVSEIQRATIPYATMIGGGLVGAPLAPETLGTSVVAGAGMGYAAGQNISDLIDRYVLGVTSGEEGVERLGGKPQTLSESLKRTGRDIITGAELEAMGQVGAVPLTKASQFLFSPSYKSNTKEIINNAGVREFEKLGRISDAGVERQVKSDVAMRLKAFKETGYKPSLSEMAPDSKTLGIVDSVLGYTPFSADVMHARNIERLKKLDGIYEGLKARGVKGETLESVGRDIRHEAKNLLGKYSDKKGDELNSLIREFEKRFTMGKSKAGGSLGDLLEADRAGKQSEISGLFEDVKMSLPKQGKDMIEISPETSNMAGELLKSEKSVPKALRDDDIISLTGSFLPKPKQPKPEWVTPEMLAKDPKLQEMFGNKPAKITWEGIQNTRSKLLERIRAIKKEKGEATTESRVYSMLNDALEAEQERFAEGAGGSAWDTYLNARQASKQMHKTYDRDLLKIMQKNPEDIIDSIIHKGEVTLIKQVREGVGEDGIELLRRGFFRKALDSATSNGVVNPLKLKRFTESIGAETFNELTTPAQREMFKRIVDRGIYLQGASKNSPLYKFLDTISGTSNEKIVDALVKPESIKHIRYSKRVLSEDRLRELASVALENKVFEKSGLDNNILPVSSAKNWVKYRNTFKELLPESHFREVDQFIRVGQHSSKVEALAKNASQTGQVFAGFSTFSQIIKAAKAGLAPLASTLFTVTVIPPLTAKILTSELALKYLTRAVALPPNSKQAIELFLKAVETAYATEKRQEGGK